jgi:hypothetical protein
LDDTAHELNAGVERLNDVQGVEAEYVDQADTCVESHSEPPKIDNWDNDITKPTTYEGAGALLRIFPDFVKEKQDLLGNLVAQLVLRFALRFRG